MAQSFAQLARQTTGVGLAAVLSLFVHQSVAQENEAADKPRRGGLEEVIVTAQRAEESIQDVPIAVTALTGQMLEDRQIINPSDLQLSAPNVSFTATNFGGQSFSIRGIGRLVIAQSGEAGVSTHINEIPIGSNLNAIEFFDVERVELLRGPQGTLFGRNATGGSVNMVTKMPNFEGLDGFVDLELGDYEHQRIKGAINIPIGSSVGLRLAGFSLERDGYIKNLAHGQANVNSPDPANPETLPAISDTVDGRDLKAFRGTVLWEPNDNLSIWAQYNRFEEDDNRVRITNQVCKTSRVPVNGCEPNEEGFEVTHLGATTAGIFAGALGALPRGASGAEPAIIYDYPRPASVGLREMHTDLEPIFEYEEDTILLGIDFQLGAHTLGLLYGSLDATTYTRQDYNMDVGPNLNPVAGVNAPGVAEVPATQTAPLIPAVPVTGHGGRYFTANIPRGPGGERNAAGPCALEPSTVGGARAGTLGVTDPENPGVCVHPYAGTGRVFAYDQTDNDTEYTTAEIKINSNYSGRFNFVAGLSTYQSEIASDYYVVANTLDLLTSFPSPFFGGISLYPGYFSSQTNKLEQEGMAVFGEAYFDVSDKFKLTLGLRYNVDEKTIVDSNLLFNSVVTAVGLIRPTLAPLLGSAATGTPPTAMVPAAGTPQGDLLRRYNDAAQIAALQTALDEAPAAATSAAAATAAATAAAALPLGATTEEIAAAELAARQGVAVGAAVVAWVGALGRVPAGPGLGESRALTGSPNNFEWKEWTGRFGFDWKMRDDSLFYGFLTKGYKPGGFNPSISEAFQSTSSFSFDPEEVLSVEFGIKNTFLDGAMVFNASVFNYDYKGLQVTRIANNSSLNENIDAKISGLELEFLWGDIAPGLSLDATYSYLSSEVDGSSSVDPLDRTAGNPDWVLLKNIDAGPAAGTTYIARVADLTPLLVGTALGAARGGAPSTILAGTGVDAASLLYPVTPERPVAIPAYFSRNYLTRSGTVFGPGGVAAAARPEALGTVMVSDGLETSLDGNSLPNSPEHSFRVGLTYALQLGSGSSLALRWDYYWQDEAYAREYNTKGDEIEAWDQHNISATYTTLNDRLQLRLWIRNLEDEENVTGKYLTSDTSGFYRNYFLTEPRIYGASVRYSFGG